ncbi:PH domain-containing protein [Candidatus Woesearchaeota archaeon]|nr:PH domain-containing protein [Candidatus Woesearchaeota archaeon]
MVNLDYPTEEQPIYLRKTRKAFIVEYICGGFLIVLLIIGVLKGLQIKPVVFYFIGGLSLVSLSIAEFNLAMVRYKILPHKLVITSGIIKQKKKNVYFHPLGFVPDLNVKQGRIQRIFNIGTVYLMSGSENAFELKDVDRPHRILELVETLIDDNRNLNSRKK